MFQRILNPDNPLMITMTHITDCIFLSLFYMLGCFPVLTAGAASTALYDAVYYGFRKKDKHSWQRFVISFRRNLKGSIPALIPFLLVLGMIGYGILKVWNAAVYGNISWMMLSAAALVAVVVLGVLSVLFPLLSRFETTTAQLLKNTVFLSFANMPRTLCLGGIYAVSILLCARFIFPLFFLPALASLLSTYLIEPMLRPYLPQEDEETAAE